ncbi:MAG TPA: diaminopimelate epimerase [Castellaniella sp.]|uniref:diaminopimelate epimerase n=1 Tax=Castellaniella sp. TaxID=1955812 RepID=UPI002F01B392
MIWNFTKMHGAGNDFVVLDGVSQSIDLTAERARALADRHFGVGADQLLLVERARQPDTDFRYRIFNADGGEVEHCGNGARCFVRFVHEQGLSQRNPLRAEIATGVIVLHESVNGDVTVEMGRTGFGPERVAFDASNLPTRPSGNDTQYGLDLEGEAAPVWCSLVAISNPHAVVQVENVETYPVHRIGPLMEQHVRFAHRVNAGFMQVCDRHHIQLRVYERGAGETLACGTGACAAVAAGIRRGLLDSPVRVDTHGGTLQVEWDGDNLHLKGPATTVFQGQIDIDTLTNPKP